MSRRAACAESYRAEDAARFDALDPSVIHGEFLRLAAPTGWRGRNVLDVGAGSGRDARLLAERGARVTAAEPSPQLRDVGAAHCAPGVDWIDDALPGLTSLGGRCAAFDIVWCSAVWHHLSPRERRDAMTRIASLLRPAGRFFLSLRHGPAPAGRIAFPCDAPSEIASARCAGLRLVRLRRVPSVQEWNRANGVQWTRLLFRKTAVGAP
ncbi:MAG: class I SAM-dependent methyltransferase [Pseudomonadota bacterium]